MNNSYELPGWNCGLCGYRKCEELAERINEEPEIIKRCIPLSKNSLPHNAQELPTPLCVPEKWKEYGIHRPVGAQETHWQDSLGREFDFYLEHFPEDPGPREIILPRNPMLTKELKIKSGEILIGRPLGMSCGCPITHCGVVMNVEQATGVIVWCVTGPLQPRAQGYKDLGYYSAEAYEGIIKQSRCEIKIGLRYYFQPRMCMLQWRHSGLVNFINRTPNGLQVRLEGLWIG